MLQAFESTGKAVCIFLFLLRCLIALHPQTNSNNCVFMTIQKRTVVCLQITFHMLVINIERIIPFVHIIAALFCLQFASVNLIHFLITFGVHIHFAISIHAWLYLKRPLVRVLKKKKKIHKEAAVPLVAAVACVKN